MTLSNQVKIGLLGVIVSALALIFIATQLDLALFWEAWRTANYWYVIPSILLLTLGLLTRAFRWRVLLSHELPLRRTFNIMNVGYFVNGVLPLRIGEVARIYLVSRTRKAIPMLTTTSTIVVERILDLFAVVLIVLLAVALGPVPTEVQVASRVAAILAIVAFIILIILASRRDWAEKLFHNVLQVIPILKRFETLETWFGQFLDGLMPLTKLQALVSLFAWTVISWVLSILAGYVLMFAFFDEGSMVATMLFIATASFAVALPAVPGNVGTFEASVLLALVAMGYGQSNTSIAFAVMLHAVNVLVYAVTGVWGLIQEGISIGQLSEGVQQMQQSTETGQTK